MTKVLVTGGSGFIGQRIISALDGRHYDWINYDLEDSDDIRDEFKLNSVFERNQPEIVIHLAARAGVRNGNDYPNEYLSTNVIGTNNIIRMCQKHNVKKLIFYSSSSVLGGNKENSSLKGLTEDDEYDCHSLYAQTKMFGEQLVKQSGLNYIIIRPFTVYGENGRGDMVIYKWINEIKSGKDISFYGDGETSRGYTYVQDLANATLDLMKLDKSNLIVNLGGSEVIKLKELLEIFTKACDNKKIKFKIKKLPMPKQDVKNSVANTELAKSLIGFEPKNNFYNIVDKILKNEL